MSAGIQFLSPDLAKLQLRLNALTNNRFDDLLTMIGGIVESQTRRRIHDEKTSPGGEPWQAWSDDYAKTRHANQSLLFASGDLEDSIQFEVVGFELYWGSNLAYAHNQNFGTTVPQREFLGLSSANEQEIMKTIESYFDSKLNSTKEERGYHIGPRGGVYYVNSSGNKSYQ